MSSRRVALTTALALTAVVAVTNLSAQSNQEVPFDVLIRGGRIVDGTGNPWFYGDVGIRGGQIAAVGRLANADATRVIDGRRNFSKFRHSGGSSYCLSISLVHKLSKPG